jgi:hypothetical protein
MKRALTFMAIVAAGITLANPAQWAAFDDHYFAARETETPLPYPGLTNTMVAYWPLDSNANDYTSTNHGTVFNAIATNGLVGGAYKFDGAGDYISFGQGDSLNLSTGITVSVWIKQTSGQYFEWVGILMKGTAASEEGTAWMLIMNATNNLRFYIEASGSWKYGDIALPYDTGWHHLVGTYDKENVRLYLDNAAGTPQASTANISVRDTTDVEAGRDINYGQFQGVIDEIGIWGRVLSTNEIEYIYNSGAGVSLTNRFN